MVGNFLVTWSVWRAHDHSFPVTSTVQGRKWRFLVLLGVPRCGWSRESPGQTSVGRLEPANAEATATELCGGMGLSQACMRSSQIPELSKMWSLLFHDQTEIGPCGWRFAGVRGKLESMWAQGLPGYSRGYSGQFHVLHVT